MFKFKIFHLAFLIHSFIWAQFSDQIIVSDELIGARGVYAADMDGDLDMDILIAAENSDRVSWFKNLDSNGNFSEEIIIDDPNSPVDVFPADFDGDNDLDIVVAVKGPAPDESLLLWYENLDGQGNFGTEIIISDLIQGALAVYAADFDGDEDMDVLLASFTDNTVSWFNNDGFGNFSDQIVLSNSALSVRDAIAVDLDSDKDMDVLSLSTSDESVIWFENLDGMGDFSEMKFINTNTNSPISVYAGDLDGDSDIDVVANSPADGKIFWYEHLDGEGAFSEEKLITENIIFPFDVFVADLDHDNDNDVLAVSSNDDKVFWYENVLGNGTAWEEHLITDQTDLARSVYVTDLDGDNKVDVISASEVDGKVAWYKNEMDLGLQDVTIPIDIYPNPFSDSIIIDSTYPVNSVVLYDLFGARTIIESNKFKEFNLAYLSNGLYFLEINTDNGRVVKKIIKKK